MASSSGALRHACLTFIVGSSSSSSSSRGNSGGDGNDNIILPVLLKRLRCNDEELLVRTLYLFDTLLATYDACVLHELVLQFVNSGAFLAHAVSPTMHFEHVQKSLTTYNVQQSECECCLL